MKRNYLYIGITILLITVMASCKKYLDVNAQSSNVYISSPNDLQLLLDSYSVMNSNYPADQIVSSDDYFTTDANLLSLGSPTVDPTSNALYRWDATAIAPYNVGAPDWQNAYQRIYTANLVLENVATFRSQPNPSATLDGIEGAALFFRAYNLWAIAQLYTKGYIKASATQDMGVPLRLTSDVNENITRSTVQQTYDQVTGDLEKAVPLLANTAAGPSRPSKAAAYAMLARVYLSMGNYAQALQNATSSLAINNQLLDYNTISTTSTTPFTRFNVEDLFHTTDRYVSLLGNFYAYISAATYATYDANDLRKQIFFKNAVPYGAPAGSYYFSGSYDQSLSASTFTGLAVDEIYLTRAECYARNGDATSAMGDLNTLLKNRYVNTAASPFVPVTAADATTALTRILQERKKELLFRGLRWTDLKRLNLDAGTAVTLTRVNNNTTYTLPPNDLRYALLIPTLVISSGNVVQNPR